MAAEEPIATHSTLSKIIVYTTVISGFVAACLMFGRGESLVAIKGKTAVAAHKNMAYDLEKKL